MFERPKRGEHAILVSITLTRLVDQPDIQEFTELAQSAGAKIITQVTGTREWPEPSTFVGRGKLEELQTLVQAYQADVVLFNHALSPGQERHLERALQCRVVDRTGLILDIFALRARSFEGKLQVELAQLKHLSTRLVRGWTHLERQKGGIGLRGPGETQLETDRRLIGERIKFINKRLAKVNQQRELSRKARHQNQLPVVSLVGYTNAGKSTLFNRLTQATVFAADQLFATLDTTLRRVTLPDKTTLILADTVGFIEQLPHDLVAAFRATLDETRLAALLLHIVDVSDPEWQLRVKQVNQVLTDIGAAEVPQILVCNKIDRLAHCSARLQRDSEDQITQIWLSAVSGAGIDLLDEVLSKQLNQERICATVRIPVEAGDLRARLFADTLVLHEQYAENGDSILEIQVPKQYFNHGEMDSRLQILSEKSQ
jgi:GTPase